MMARRRQGPTLFPSLGLASPVILTVLSLAGCGAAPAPGPSAPSFRPNVLILFTDDQRADTIAALGNPHIRTPNLDRLVRRGTAFTRAYCMGSLQGAVCVPSRAMLLTGRTLFRVKDDLAGQATWPEAFARAGYTTFLTGKWHNAGRIGPARVPGGQGDLPRRHGRSLQAAAPGHLATSTRSSTRAPSGEHSVKLFADAAVEFLRGQSGERAVPLLRRLQRSRTTRAWPRSRTTTGTTPISRRSRRTSCPGIRSTTARWRSATRSSPPGRERRRSSASTSPTTTPRSSILDAQVGRILDALEASGQDENTLIVFTSDHGLAIGSHGLFGKQNLYDHSMHVAADHRRAGHPAEAGGSTRCATCSTSSRRSASSPASRPRGQRGPEPRPDPRRPAADRSRLHLHRLRDVQRAVRDDRWKLIVYPQINKTQLFDLRTDPGEMHDLAEEPNHAGERERLIELLRDWQRRLNDPQPRVVVPLMQSD